MCLDLPEEIKTLEEMRALIYGTYYIPETREELQWQPKLRGLNGPMYNGLQILESGEIVPVIRYEKPNQVLTFPASGIAVASTWN